MVCEDENQACKDARDDYEKAHGDYFQAESDINRHKDNRNALGALGGAGVAIAGAAIAASGPVGWIIGGLAVASLGGGAAGGAQIRLKQARDRCAKAIREMNNAYRRAVANCRNPECVPPRPTSTCS